MSDFSDKWGLNVRYGLRWPLSTSVSEGGFGHEAALSFGINPSLNDRFSFDLIFPWGTTEGKLFASTDVAGSYANHFHWAALFAMANQRRLYSAYTDTGAHWFSVTSSTTPYLGVGTSSVGQPDRTVGGEEFSFGSEGVQTFDVGTQYGFGIEFDPVSRFEIGIAPKLTYGVHFNGEGSEWNRLNLEFMIQFLIGYGDDSSPTLAANSGPTDLEIAFSIYQALLGIPQSVFMNMTLADMQQRLGDFGIAVGEGDPGSLEDVRVLQGASAALGAIGHSNSMEFYLRMGSLNWLLPTLELARGAAGIGVGAGMDSNASLSGGAAALFNAAGMFLYMIMDVDTPSDRLEHGEDAVSSVMVTDLIRFGLNDLFAIIGAVVLHEAPDSDAGSIIFSAAGQANSGAALFIGPKDSGAVLRTTYAYSPVTFYHINYESDGIEGSDSGMRSSFIIQNTWAWDFMFSEFVFSSHALRPDNLFKRAGAAPSDPYADAALPSEVSARLGFQYEWTYVRAGGSIDTLALFGAPAGLGGGIGGNLAIDVLIPFNGLPHGAGLTFGFRGGIAALFPDGWQYEFAIPIGITLPPF